MRHTMQGLGKLSIFGKFILRAFFASQRLTYSNTSTFNLFSKLTVSLKSEACHFTSTSKQLALNQRVLRFFKASLNKLCLWANFNSLR